MKINKHDPHHWLLLAQQFVYTLVAIVGRYVTRKPDKPIVVLYGHQLSGNLKALYAQWLKTHCEAFDCFFLSLDPTYSKQLRLEKVQVLQCCRLRDMLKVGRCRVMITDHGLHLMSPLILLTDIKFVDVWHGIPFKGFSPDDFRVQHRYDEVWVSSPLIKQFYVEKFGFRHEIVHALGYARADKLFRRENSSSGYRQRASIPTGKKIVLYAPTWQQDDKGRELFPFGEDQGSFINQLSEVCQSHNAVLVIRSHLNAQIEKAGSENVFYCSMKDYPDAEALLMETDILICDWSSISFDYLALNRPTIFLDVAPPFKYGLSLGKEYRFGKVAADMDSLCSTLSVILEFPEKYFEEQGSKHEEVCAEVYGENRAGDTACRQLTHLENLIG